MHIVKTLLLIISAAVMFLQGCAGIERGYESRVVTTHDKSVASPIGMDARMLELERELQVLRNGVKRDRFRTYEYYRIYDYPETYRVYRTLEYPIVFGLGYFWGHHGHHGAHH